MRFGLTDLPLTGQEFGDSLPGLFSSKPFEARIVNGQPSVLCNGPDEGKFVFVLPFDVHLVAEGANHDSTCSEGRIYIRICKYRNYLVEYWNAGLFPDY